MKKVLWIFVLLILIAGTAFYFGWVRIEPETFGLAHSTVTGTIEYPLESGNIYWFWQKLIPKTFHVYALNKEPYDLTLETSTPLPKSENLKEFGSFNLGIKIDMRYRVRFESARVLFEKGLLGGFHSYFQGKVRALADEAISSFVIEGMTRYSYSVRTFDYTVLDVLKEDLKGRIQRHAAGYGLEDVDITIIFTEIPQLDIYVEALKNYYDYLERAYVNKEKELEEQAESMKRQFKDDMEIARLRKYGDLLTEYPVLLKYLYIEKFGERAEVMVLPQDQRTGFPLMLEPEPWTQKPRSDKGIGGGEQGVEKQFEQQEPAVQKPEAQKPAVQEPGVQKPEAQPGQETTKKKKWYEYLKFWNALKGSESQ
jgi:hypothetical protein